VTPGGVERCTILQRVVERLADCPERLADCVLGQLTAPSLELTSAQ